MRTGISPASRCAFRAALVRLPCGALGFADLSFKVQVRFCLPGPYTGDSALRA